VKMYRIKSAFGPTIQGEGSATGTVVKFLRFAGCNRWTGLEKDRAKSVCWYCDTDFRDGVQMTPIEILAWLDRLGPAKVVVISGGEATLQIDEPLLLSLTAHGYRLHLETNGSRALGDLAGFFEHITCSPKQSFEETKLEYATDLKLLFPPVQESVTIEGFKKFDSHNQFLQPVHCETYQENLQATIKKLYENPEWRLSLQTHKITGVE